MHYGAVYVTSRHSATFMNCGRGLGFHRRQYSTRQSNGSRIARSFGGGMIGDDSFPRPTHVFLQTERSGVVAGNGARRACPTRHDCH
jgi:hypothetical protein